MRIIGHVGTETNASTFSDFLLVKGINNSVEEEAGKWAIWIHSEDEIPKATDLLNAFNANPGDPRFRQSRVVAAEIKEKELEEAEKAGKRRFDRSKIFKSTTPYGIGALTLVLIMASVAVAALTGLGSNLEVVSVFRISNHYGRGFNLPEVFHGEVWRLLTPILLHGSFLHIFFNMMWMFDLGSMVEARETSWKLLALVLVIGVLSNLGQLYFVGPNFGGMSGVVYGLLGYIWMKGKFDPASGLYLHPQTVVMMLIWFFACLFNFIPAVANWAHGVGLAAGMAWGALSSLYQNRRRV
ncbi:MAG: Rhomboid family protein [Verrucomicrobiales bacterium]|nr:Rhomboid family protein [Verrucomicrobiales bacterium]